MGGGNLKGTIEFPGGRSPQPARGINLNCFVHMCNVVYQVREFFIYINVCECGFERNIIVIVSPSA